jgi:hypothetical protein
MNYSVSSIVPSYQFHETNADNNRGNRFSARPLRQWRKQLHATNGLLSYRRTAFGMPMDRPGGENVTTQNKCEVCSGSAIDLKTVIEKDPSSCKSCYIPRTGTSVSENSYTDSMAYLQSKCTTYEQKLAYNPVTGISYFSSDGFVLEPSTSPTGPQVRETNRCYSSNKCNTTIYKPNNSQFAQQGGVSSGSRISRLKYNTLNNYGAEYNSAAGPVGVNTGRYMTEPSPSYYTKVQPQKVVFPYKTGNKTYCRPEYSMCSSD